MDYEKLLTLSCDLGCELLLSGAEIYRAEDSVRYLLAAYGVETGEVFAIPNYINVSLVTPDHKPISRIRRVGPHGTDVAKLEALNDLCRKLCRETPDLDTAEARLAQAAAIQPNFTLFQMLAAYFLTTSAFSLFFGGDWMDALAGGLCGVAVGFCLIVLGRLGTNLFFKIIAGSFVCGLLAAALLACGVGHHQTPIITGTFMVLVPGLVITNFMRDIMVGDMVSGLSKLAEALLTGAGIVIGATLALNLTRMLGGAL